MKLLGSLQPGPPKLSAAGIDNQDPSPRADTLFPAVGAREAAAMRYLPAPALRLLPEDSLPSEGVALLRPVPVAESAAKDPPPPQSYNWARPAAAERGAGQGAVVVNVVLRVTRIVGFRDYAADTQRLRSGRFVRLVVVESLERFHFHHVLGQHIAVGQDPTHCGPLPPFGWC